MASIRDTAYIVYDTESVVDGTLLARVLYPGEELTASDAVDRFEKEQLAKDPNSKVFIPVSFHVPVAIGVARIGADLRLLDIKALDDPQFDPRALVRDFWRGVDVYSAAALVDFNGRGFDLPLLTLSAFRFGISCPRYFRDPDRFGFRYRFTSKHIDLQEWVTEYGAFRMRGGLNLLAKMLGKPGKMGTTGADVNELHSAGKVREINDYCLHDVLDTYFVFIRTRVLTGQIDLEEEQEIVAHTRDWLENRCESEPALSAYLDNFGEWEGKPFA